MAQEGVRCTTSASGGDDFQVPLAFPIPRGPSLVLVDFGTRV